VEIVDLKTKECLDDIVTSLALVRVEDVKIEVLGLGDVL